MYTTPSLCMAAVRRGLNEEWRREKAEELRCQARELELKYVFSEKADALYREAEQIENHK